MIGVGLNWWQAIVVIFVSQFISSIAMAFNSRSAAVYHIGFPCVGRSVFGMWGSYYFVGARAILAIIWYAVQSKPLRPASLQRQWLMLMSTLLLSVLWCRIHVQYPSSHFRAQFHRYSQSLA